MEGIREENGYRKNPQNKFYVISQEEKDQSDVQGRDGRKM
jgi:hypothetical protein